ncbi:MAG: hypothetical protein SAK29_15230 [Scytonema sp. PMC 1069.18]|nr:hypothetical protein [Scytonema sp. PMC 1069.18]MEC4883738.1 hypothetical protein [Scytonema sp. PMC 1070.18]
MAADNFKKTIPDLISGLTVYEYLILETMFEMFADLRELAAFSRKEIPSIETVFDRSIPLVAPRPERLDKQTVINKFRNILQLHGIPESKPNRYAYRRQLREMGSDMFFYIRENKNALSLLHTTN